MGSLARLLVALAIAAASASPARWEGCEAERSAYASAAAAGGGSGKLAVVVSYCTEPLDWVFTLVDCRKHQVWVYLKCRARPPVPPGARACTALRKMGSVGKANTAYVQFIVDKYTQLPQATAFLKGRGKSLLSRGRLAGLDPSTVGFANLAGKRGKVSGGPKLSRGYYQLGRKDCVAEGKCPRREVLCGLFASYGCAPCTEAGWWTGFGSMFAVSRRRILSRPLAWYQGLLRNMSVSTFVSGGTQVVSGAEGVPGTHVEALGSPSTYERLWGVMWGCWEPVVAGGGAPRMECNDGK